MSKFGLGRFGQKSPSASDQTSDTPEKPKSRRALGIMQLEPRIMFDGAAAASVDHHDSSAPATDGGGSSGAPAADHAADNGAASVPAATAPNQTNAPGPSDDKTTTPAAAFEATPTPALTAREIVFIDSRVPDLQTLIAGAAPGVEVHVLDADKDGVQQIADYLAANHVTDLTAIHIVSHGSQGAIQLGSTELNGNNLADHAQALADIGAALSADGDIGLYGCDVASQQGQQFIAALSNYTGADIAASTDATGSTALGGNWTLEATTGAIEAATPFSAAATASYQHVLAETLTTTQVTILTGDTDGDGIVDPGETVTTTVTITNNSTNVDAINVQLNETLNGMTLVPGSVKITPIAFDDSGTAFTLTGNTPMRFDVAQLLANDVDPDGAQSGLYVSAVSSGANGSVALFDNGTLTTADDYVVFTPNAGYEGAASFQYTIKDTQGLASVSTGVVTLTVTDPVWYVDATNGNDVTGNGTYNNPFASLAPLTTGGSADALDDSNDTIFIYDRGAAAYNSGIVLENGQKLFGDSHAFTVNGLTIGATTNNSIINNAAIGVTLAANNTIDGITINGTANTAIGIFGTDVGTLVINNVSETGAGKIIDITGTAGNSASISLGTAATTSSTTEAIRLVGINGSFSATGGAISGANGTDVLISGGTATVNIASSIASDTGGSIEVTGRGAAAGGVTFSGQLDITGGTGISVHDNTAGAVTFSNAHKVVSTGANTAVSLVNNTGATVNFTNGGLDIDTLAGVGFLATGGGTLNVTGANNSVTTQTGRIINWDGVITNASFTTLQATGTVAADAISLNNVDGTSFVGGIVSIAGTSGAGSDGIAITGGSAANFSFSGATIDNTGGHGINLSGANGTVTFNTVDIDGAGDAGISTTSNTNAVTINGGSIGSTNDPAGRGVDINGGSANVSIAASITKTTAGKIVEVSDRAGGTVTISGALNASGGVDNGINVTANSIGSVQFTSAIKNLSTGASAAVSITNNNAAAFTTDFLNGGLVIATTSGVGFDARPVIVVGGGTVTVQGTGNTITSTSGTALNVVNTTIGAGNLNFQSITSNAAGANGIVVNNTGSSGALIVTGTGAAGSGGTISNKTGDGIVLTDTVNASLSYMNISNNDGNGILGTRLNGLKLTSLNVSGNADTQQENGIRLLELTGDATHLTQFTNIVVSNSFANNLHVLNTGGTLTNLVVTGSSFTNIVGNLGSKFLFESNGNGDGNLPVMKLTMTGNTFGSDSFSANNVGRGLQVISGDGTVNVHIGDGTVAGRNIFTNNYAAIDLDQAVSGNLNFDVNNNTFTWNDAVAINVFSSGATSKSMDGFIRNNTIGIQGVATSGARGGGISIGHESAGTAKLLIDSNVVQSLGINGVIGGPSIGVTQAVFGGTVHATITNNIIRDNADSRGVTITATQVGAVINADVHGNTITNVVGPQFIRFLADGLGASDGTINVPQASEVAIEAANGNVAALTDARTFFNQPPPLLPNATPLMAAPGGVEAAPANQTDEPTSDTTPTDSGTTPPDQSAGSSTEPPAGEGTDTPPVADAPPVVVDDGLLSQSELDAMVEAAMQRWAEAGLTESQLAALRGLNFTVADMTGWSLGSYRPDLITLDVDAAGHGWYIDTTPLNDSEFGNAITATQLQTDQNGAPAGHFDLLTTIMHEMGHALGLSDSYTLDSRASLMYGYLVMGERRLVSDGQASDATAGSIHGEEFLGAPVVIGTLPAGKSVQVIWQATIDPQTNQLIVNPVNQGTVSAGNAVGFPDQTTNTVTTVLDSLTLGSKIWNDANGNGVDDGETGIAAVNLTLFADTNGNNVWDAGDTQIATTVTNAGGNYSFTGLAEGNYIVRVDAGNFLAGGPLAGFSDTSAGFADPDNNGDGDDNGGPLTGGVVYTQAITLNFNSEPTAGIGNDTNNTVDIGFITNAKPDVNSVNSAAFYTENAAPTVLSSGLTVTDGNDANLASAIVKINDFVAGDVLSVNVGATGIVASYDGAGTLTLTGPATVAQFEQVLRTVAYSSTSENPTSANTDNTRNVSWQVNDGQPSNNLSDVETTIVALTAVNDAPVLDATKSPVLGAVNEDAGAPGVGSGTLVSGLVDFAGGGGFDNVSDPDGTTTIGIALTGADTANGTWKYSTDGGATWTDVGAVSDGSALLLLADAQTRLYFQANADYNGGSDITFRAWDRSNGDGLAGTTVDVSSNGGVTPYSTASDTAAITVNAVSDTVGDTLTVNEDGSCSTNVLTNDNFEDAGRTLTAVSQGTNGAVTFAADGTVTYTPNADFFGNDSFTYTVTSNGTTETATVNVTVNAAADIVNDSATTNEDTAVTTNVLANDTFENTPAVSGVTQGANGTVVNNGDGTVTYTPNADFNGTDSYSYTVTSGGVTETATVIVTIGPVADIVNDTATTNEDTAVTTNVLANDTFEGSPVVSGVTQGAHGTVVNNGNGTVTYTANADFNGTDSYTYTVTSPAGVTETATVSVTVNAVADIVNDSATTNEDTAVTTNVLANDTFEGSPVVTGVTQGANGTVVNNNNGTMTYTPNADFNGTDSYTYTVTSPAGVTETATVNVTVNAVADIVNDTATTNEDAAVTTNVLTNDNFEASPVVTGVTNGSNGTVVNNNNGTVTYTPNADFYGTDIYTYTVTSGGITETATVTVTVNAVVDIANDTATTNEDTAVTTNVLTNDTFEGTPVVTGVTQGANGSVVNNGDGTVTYTPNADFNGVDTYTYMVTSGGAIETATVTVTVNAVGDIVNDAATTNEDTAVTTNVLANDSFDGSPTVSSVTQGTNGTVVNNGNGTVTYTPNADFNGTDSYTYTVTSGGVTETATVSVTVGPVADIVNDTVTTNEDAAVTTNVLANDTFEGSPVVSGVTQGAHGTVVNNNNGTVTYTANADFNGTDSYTYTVTSPAGVTETATVNVTINAVADIANDAATTNEDTAVTTNVLANDTFEGVPVVTGVTQGANGTVVNNNDGTVTYTPTADFNGTDTYTYTVTSPTGVTETATVTVTVNAVADVTNDTLTTNEDTAITANVITGTNGASADSFESSGRTLTSVTQGANGSVTFLANGTVTYTPNLNYNGADSFTYTVTSGGVTETATVTVNIAPVNDPAIISGDSTGVVVEAGGVANGTTNTPTDSGTLTNTDVDNPPSTFQAAAAGSSTINGYGTYQMTAGGTWTYTLNNANPAVQALNVGQTLTDSFTVMTADGTTQVVTVTINGANDSAVVAGDTSDTVVEAGGVNNNDSNDPIASGTLTSNDIDNADNAFQADLGASSHGVFTVFTNGTWIYLLNNSDNAVQALKPGNTLTDTFVVHTLDGTAQTVTITINGDNDAPDVDSNNNISYNANNGGSVLVNPNIDLSDVDSTVITGATVAITAGRDTGDRLLFTNQGGITGSYNTGTGILTLTGNASVAAYETALKSVRFTSTSDDSGPRTVSWRATDGLDNSGPGTTTIQVRGVDRHHHRGDDGHYDDNRGNNGGFYSSSNGLITNVSTNERWNGSIGSGYFYVNADIRRVGLDGSILELQTPVAALGDALGGDAVQTTATLADGKPLPDWLKFDPQTGILAGRLPANVVASIQPNVGGQESDDAIVTGSVGNGNGNGTEPTATHGKISVQITSRDAQGNIATTIFTIDLADKRSWLPGDRDARHHAAIELQRALAGSSVAPTAFMAPALDGIEETLADAGDGAGRIGLSQQLDGHGWRGMHADRMALIASLQQSAAGWR